MKQGFIFITSFLFCFSLLAQDTTYNQLLDFVDCGRAKTFTFKLEAECHPNEVILKRWLLKDVGTPAEEGSLQTFYFTVLKNNKYELTRGSSLWPAFSKKILYEIDSINNLDEQHRMVLVGLSKTDSLHNTVNRLPGLEKRRNNFWNARKLKKAELTNYLTIYNDAQNKYDEGELEPQEWDKIEVTYLSLEDEVNFIKKELRHLNKKISKMRRNVVRLKKETGLYQYKSYRTLATPNEK